MRDGGGDALRVRYYIWAFYIRCGIKIRNFAGMSLETVAHFIQPVSQVVITPLINVTGRKVARQNTPKRPPSQDCSWGGAIQRGDGRNEARRGEGLKLSETAFRHRNSVSGNSFKIT